MNVRNLIQFFDDYRKRKLSLVLATVYETEGSTYSKAGARMLIDADGVFQGMLSGGCLEGDLGMRARDVIASGDVQTVTYDLASDNDELWGMGVGCDGLIRVILQRVTAEDAYEPLAEVLEVYKGADSAVAATINTSAGPGKTTLPALFDR